MAGDDEELQLLLSGMSAAGPSGMVTNDDINNILFASDMSGGYGGYMDTGGFSGQVQYVTGQDVMLDPMAQLLSDNSGETVSFYDNRQRTVSLSVASPESGIDLGSDYTDPASVSPSAHDTYSADTPMSNASGREFWLIAIAVK